MATQLITINYLCKEANPLYIGKDFKNYKEFFKEFLTAFSLGDTPNWGSTGKSYVEETMEYLDTEPYNELYHMAIPELFILRAGYDTEQFVTATIFFPKWVQDTPDWMELLVDFLGMETNHIKWDKFTQTIHIIQSY